MLDKFCRWWGVGTSLNKLPSEISMMGLVSFGATSTRLTKGSQRVVLLGQELLQTRQSPRIVTGEFAGNPLPQLEKSLKLDAIGGKLITAGQVISTIEEAEAWKALVYPSFIPRTLVVVTDEMHSRSARRVSNRVWNGWWGKRLVKRLLGIELTSVLVVTFPTREAIDPESPMIALRSQRLWVRNNVARELFLMFMPFGYTIMKRLNIHQPTSIV